MAIPSAATTPWDSKSLRARFLDRYRSATRPATLNVVAHMLLEVDRVEQVIHVGLGHLAESLSVGRVDVGFGSREAEFHVAVAEHRVSGAVSMVGKKLPNHDPVLQRVWRNVAGVAFDALRGNPAVAHLRYAFEAVGSRAMLAQRLDHDGRPFGIVCIDDLESDRTWTEAEQRLAWEFCRDFFGPIVGISRALCTAKHPRRPSPAELDAIRLAAAGKSYKEIAAELGKSIRTVEFQLRNARRKTGVCNQVELVRFCEPWL